MFLSYNEIMICYFFGTFNPIHLGHIEIAKRAKEIFGFDKVIYVPTYMPPHKSLNLANFKERFDMVKLSAGSENVSDIEFHLPVPSYTYRTIEKLYQENNNQKINFLIGYDQFFKLEQWREPDILKEKLNFIVYPRDMFNGQSISDRAFEPFVQKGYSFRILKSDFLNISSTQIREYVSKNQDITGLVTKEVREYIEEHRLYKKLAEEKFVR